MNVRVPKALGGLPDSQPHVVSRTWPPSPMWSHILDDGDIARLRGAPSTSRCTASHRRVTVSGAGGSVRAEAGPFVFARTIRDMSTQPSALARSLETARGLKPGTWDAVEALSILAVEARGLPDGSQLLALAQATASRLKSGSWEAVRALAWLSRAERELADSATATKR